MEGNSLPAKTLTHNFLGQIIESISDPLIVLDISFNYQYINEAAEKYIGKTFVQLNEKYIWDLFPNLNDSLFKSSCGKALFTQDYQFLEEYYFNKDVWVEYNIYPNPQGLVIFFKNITSRKKAESENLKLIKRNALLIETMQDLFLLLDENLDIVDVNPAYCRVLGYTKEELVRRNLIDLEYKYTREELLRLIKEAIKDEKTLIHTQKKKKNGEIIDVEVAVVEMLVDGHTNFATFGRDVSALNKAQTQLKESNARFELIASATQEAFWEVEMGTKRMWANEVHQNMYGLTKFHPVPGSKEWEKRIHIDERERIKKGLQQAILDKLTTWTEEYLFYTENKGWITVYDRTHLIYDNDKNVLRMLGSMTNITDLKKAEHEIIFEKELSDSIINSLPGIFYMINKEGKILRWNANFEKVSKYNKDEIANIHALNLFHTDEKELLQEKIKEVFEKGHAEVEIYFYTKELEKVPFYLNGKLIIQNGEEYLIGMGLDLSEIKKVEKNLHQLEQQMLLQKVQEQKRIARAIIKTQEKERNHIGAELHDNVNQLLAGARLYLNIAGKSNPAIKDLVCYPMELIDNAIKEIRTLTSQHVTPVKNAELKQLIQSLIETLTDATEIKTKLVCDGDESFIPVDLKINIYRILQELVNNIIRHAECKNVLLFLKCTGDHIEILLEEDGKGFYTNQKAEGIGLSNITNRVNSFNGEIIIDSAPGKGCRTRIKIPLNDLTPGLPLLK